MKKYIIYFVALVIGLIALPFHIILSALHLFKNFRRGIRRYIDTVKAAVIIAQLKKK